MLFDEQELTKKNIGNISKLYLYFKFQLERIGAFLLVKIQTIFECLKTIIQLL